MLALIISPLLSLNALAFNAITSSTKSASNPALVQFETVAEAKQQLTASDNSRISQQDNWLIIEQTINGKPAVWSFVPETHPAYPAVSKRTLVTKQGVSSFQLALLCEGEQQACQQLYLQQQEQLEFYSWAIENQ